MQPRPPSASFGGFDFGAREQAARRELLRALVLRLGIVKVGNGGADGRNLFVGKRRLSSPDMPSCASVWRSALCARSSASWSSRGASRTSS
jgi:hypothetical protein